MSHAGYEFTDAGKFFALDQLRLRGLEGLDGHLELLVRTLQVRGHPIEDVGQFAALIGRLDLDPPRKVATPDRFGAVAQRTQRPSDLADEEPDNGGADEDAQRAYQQQRLLRLAQRAQGLLVGREQ